MFFVCVYLFVFCTVTTPPLSLSFSCQTLHMILYDTTPSNRHQFKLDKWTDQGPSINAAFGSETEEDVRELHLIMSAMLVKSPSSVAMVNYTDSRFGDDSSGYFMTDHNSSRSNPNVVHPYSAAGRLECNCLLYRASFTWII